MLMYCLDGAQTQKKRTPVGLAAFAECIQIILSEKREILLRSGSAIMELPEGEEQCNNTLV